MHVGAPKKSFYCNLIYPGMRGGCNRVQDLKKFKWGYKKSLALLCKLLKLFKIYVIYYFSVFSMGFRFLFIFNNSKHVFFCSLLIGLLPSPPK